MAGQLSSRQLTHDLFTAAFLLAALDITTQSVSLTSLLCAMLSSHCITVSPGCLLILAEYSVPLCSGCSLLSSRSPSISEAPSLAAAHHWTAHPQLVSPALPSADRGARTHRSWSRPVTTVSPVTPAPATGARPPVCGPVELPQPSSPACSQHQHEK